MERTTKFDNEKYCVNCGQIIDIKAEICPKCGVRQFNSSPFGYMPVYDPQASDKDWLVTLLICFFGGIFGLHRFYVGKVGTGILQLLTGGGCGIWWIVDLIMIVLNNFKDNQGRVIKNR